MIWRIGVKNAIWYYRSAASVEFYVKNQRFTITMLGHKFTLTEAERYLTVVLGEERQK